MWATDQMWGAILAGDHQVSVQASAWYGGECTVPDLEVTAATYREEYTSGMVRASASRSGYRLIYK